jgi:hypothetical protein
VYGFPGAGKVRQKGPYMTSEIKDHYQKSEIRDPKKDTKRTNQKENIEEPMRRSVRVKIGVRVRVMRDKD